MTGNPFHLAWFTNARPHGWMPQGPDVWAGNDIDHEAWSSGAFLVDMAKSLDRAGFDFMMLEDHVATEPYEGMEPRLDPFPLLPLIGAATKNLGVIATMSTSFWPPYLLARLTASVDHLTGGRTGWNIVTTSEDYAARAFGLGDRQPPHDERYARADEFTDFVTKLWDAWDADAVIADPVSGRYVDRTKVKDFTFEGKYYSGCGPMNVARSPQGRPIVCQAGGSARGRAFAARHADVILVSSDGANSYAVLKAYRDDVRALAAGYGRDPDSVKVLIMVTPVLGDTDAMAQELFERRYTLSEAQVQAFVKGMGGYFALDFTRYALDEPLPPEVFDFHTEGHQATLANFLAHAGEGRTFRDMIMRFRPTSLDLFGTPGTVADKMEEAIDAIGGDGFLIQSRPLTRRYITEITEGLVPELQRRGRVRRKYEGTTLRDNLMAF